MVGVVVAAVVLLVGAVVVVLRWDHVKAWFDAPDLLRVEAAAREVPLPGDAQEDATRSAAAQIGVSRAGWTDLAPRAALEELAVGLRARDVTVDPVLCEDPAVPLAPSGGVIECGMRVPVVGEDLWVLATDRTPRGEVPLTRTAVWFAWDTLDMSWPLYERLVAADPYPYPFRDADDGGPQPASAEEVATALPDRYVAVLDHCWEPARVEGTCIAWEAPVDTGDLPADRQVEALVRELVEAGFFVDVADPVWGDEPLRAHRFTVPGGWTGVQVTLRFTADGLVAQLHAL